MRRSITAAGAAFAVAVPLLGPLPHHPVRQLPAGVIELHSEMVVDADSELRGAPSGTVLHLAPDFAGRAAIVVGGDHVALRDFTIDGNRAALETRAGLPPSDTSFAKFTRANGVFAEHVTGLTIERLACRNIAGFAVLASRARSVAIRRVTVADSGSRNSLGRNNSTGGILFEEGTTDFRVTNCELSGIRGNGIWTHSLYTSPRNARGVISLNRIREIGRDAIQAGHATALSVTGNSGSRIGFPLEEVDIENGATPVAIDTAGNVDASSYDGNRFEEIDGKCIDLDGFHDGEVRANQCINRDKPEAYRFGHYGITMNNANPDMRSQNIRLVDNLIDGTLYGGIFVIGSGHTIARNRLLGIDASHCNENAAHFACYYGPGDPEILEAGIYLARGAEHPAPASHNLIRDNRITGFKMQSRCILAAPGVDPHSNTILNNVCRDQ
ncbi:MAG: right-handed parallel beta-helix repeat-containing protein [Bryobacteraceae bacterium]